MTDNSRKILMLGLPESGKTSFLAAFVHYVDSDVAGKNLAQYKLSSNTIYITSILQDWLKGKKQERTKITATTTGSTLAELYLEQIDTSQKFTIHIPDFYGEIFENQFFDRLLEIDYISEMSTSDGILLFIHPEKIKEATLIEDIQGAIKAKDLINASFESQKIKEKITDTEYLPDENIKTVSETIKRQLEPFNVENCPTQLVLVDILEANFEYTKSLPVKLAIVVSAWDTVIKDMEDLTPMKWIENTQPLLFQYLKSNVERINSKCFGISALGGDITDKQVVEKLTSLSEPSERILVQEDDTKHHNIASPVEWILKQWQKTTT